MMKKAITRTRMATALALLAAGAGITACASSEGSPPSAPPAGSGAKAAVTTPYEAKLDPANFVATVDNPYFPLKPGTVYRYKGAAENGKTVQYDDMVVTNRTKKVLGIDATVVSDVVSDGKHKPIEKTFDWYAQDKDGNVWYLGEDTREPQNGRFVPSKGAWEAGVDGAQAGIIMPAHPDAGDTYRQEYYAGHAEDQAKVIGDGGAVSVPAGSYKSTVLTEETSPRLEPGIAERKWYVAGVGNVREQGVKGEHDTIELVSVTGL
jgi:hypothetical protein